ncbi:c-type cytochrome [Lichenicoccus sp.]|uniref:c-type cytochrome n=1 Tax=Lichenicoccus sp. TaxID=2781899 RepID=UPI003D1516DB
MKLGQEGEARRPDTVFMRIALLAVFAVVVGVVILPMASQPQGSLWSRVCGALGLGHAASTPPAPFTTVSQLGSVVAWTRATDSLVRSGDGGRGQQLAAASCAACHGAAGRAAMDNVPYLDGFSRRTIYKQLVDYRSGRRVAPVMNGVAQRLTDAQIADIAAYYAREPRQAVLTRATADTDAGRLDPVVKLVYQGDPRRDIAPCASCHGPDGFVAGAPVLFGQSEAYLAAQLQAFRAGTRHNDNLAQMRTPALRLDTHEILGLAAYLSPSASASSP